MGDSELLGEAFSQLDEAQKARQPKESKRFGLSEEVLLKENLHVMFRMSTFKLPEQQPELSCLKMLTAMYERAQGFLTPFYELEHKVKTPEETELTKAECKKGFYVPLAIKDGNLRLEDLFFAVMITDESENQQKHLKAVGTVNFSDIIRPLEKKEAQDVDKWESFEVKMGQTKDMGLITIGNINKSIGEGLGDGGKSYFNVKFKTKMVPSSKLNDNDSVLDQVKIPSLLTPKVN